MKTMVLGLYILSLIILDAILVWDAGFPTYVCYVATALLWLSAGLAGVLLLGVPGFTPKLYWGKPVWDKERIRTLSYMIVAGPFMLILLTLVSHPIFLRDKSIRDIMRC